MSDRKYRHSGYQDEERREDRRPAPAGARDRPDGPRNRPEGPRGRGLGAPTVTVFRCRICGTRQRLEGTVALDAVCANCGNDLHTCSNCIHFDTSRPKECRKPVAERVTNKSRRNACELMTPNTVQEFASDRPSPGVAGEASSGSRAAFDALFNRKK